MDYAWYLFSFKGRINRAGFLAVQLALIAVWLMPWLGFSFHFSSQWEALDWVVVITMVWINAATTAKRLHDRNRSGWWAVAIFIVSRLCYLYYGLFLGLHFGVGISTAWELLFVMLAVALSLLQTGVIIELFFMIGTDGRNRFGSDPLASVATGIATDLHWDQRSVPGFLVHGAVPPPEAH